MDLDKLVYFRTTADTLSVRRAAELLHRSPAAISKTLRQLESEFSTKLFLPSGRGLALTDDGHKLYSLSTRVLQEYDELRRYFSDRKPDKQSFRLATYCIFSAFFLDELFARFLPDITSYVRRASPGDLEQELVDHVVDYGLTYLPVPHAALDFLEVGKFKMRVYARGDRFRQLALGDLPFVSSVAEVSAAGAGKRSLDGWPFPHLPRQVKYQVASLEMGLALCRRGLAAVFCPDFTVALHNALMAKNFQLVPLKLTELSTPPSYAVYLVKRKSDGETREIKRMAMGIRKLLRETEQP